mmetsp:Transcript_26120/g.61140  ORF Transcript_26120/g.61140 Transcript_26120/m.61140 type:complete len:230 (-) Transcript_26120:15-704(-)
MASGTCSEVGASTSPTLCMPTGLKLRRRSDDMMTHTDEEAITSAASSGGSSTWKSGQSTPAAKGSETRLKPNAQTKLSLIRLKVAFEICSAAYTPMSELRMSTILAESIAMSVPAPSAMPRSACESAGASLMPSPTIATTFPAACSAFTCATLPCGFRPASTRSVAMPTCAPTARAVRSLSPEHIQTSMPEALSASTAAFASALTASATPTSPQTGGGPPGMMIAKKMT